MTVRLLLVEDDPRVADFLRRGLEAEGYLVDHARDGREGLAKARGGEHRLLVLDRMLPGGDGLELCVALKAESWPGAVLMLTARDAVRDRVDGLKAGADDYLVKPFALDELLARLEVLLRRTKSTKPEGVGSDNRLRVGGLVLDPDAREVTRDGRKLELTAREFHLLGYLMEHPGKVVSRARILNAVWNYSFDPTTKVVDVYIRYLRQKIDRSGELSLIRAVRGVGYGLVAGAEPEPDPPNR